MSFFEDQKFLYYIKTAQDKWAIPAVSVTLLDNGSVQTKGFGHPTSGPVDEDSIWSICSNSKLFTVVALAILVEEGILNWTDKLCDLVPELDLQDGYASKTLTLEDVLAHRSGIPSYIDAECPRHSKPSGIVAVLNALRPTKPALKEFQYNNGFYALAGYIVTLLSGKSYSEFVAEKILVPLGMNSSSFGYPMDKSRSVTPCAAIFRDGSIDVGPGFQDMSGEHSSFPGGGLLSSAKDMAIWLAYLLRLSRQEIGPNDPPIIQPSTFAEIMRGRALAGQQIGGIPTKIGEALFPEFSPPVYGLGVQRCHYRGMDIAYHWGCGPGAGSVVLFVPARNMALAVFTNVQSAAFSAAPAIALGALDHLAKFSQIDWVKRIYNLPCGRNDKASEPPSKRAGISGSDASGVLGTYHNAAFGDLHVFDLETDPATLSKQAANTLQNIKKATTFGAVFAGKPDYIAIYEKDPLFVSYLAIIHVEESKYWAEGHLLTRAGDKDNFVDMTDSVAMFDGAGVCRLDFIGGKYLEMYKSYVDGEAKVGNGNATFIKVETASAK